MPGKSAIIERVRPLLRRECNYGELKCYESGYEDGLRLASVRFGHQEGCGEGCAYCDVTRWASEIEKR